MIDAKITLELLQNGVQKFVNAKASEYNARRILVTFTENGKVFNVSGYSFKVYHKDGDDVYYYDDPEQVYQIPGTSTVAFVLPANQTGEKVYEFCLTQNNTICYAPQFKVFYEGTIGPGNLPDPGTEPAYEPKLTLSDVETDYDDTDYIVMSAADSPNDTYRLPVSDFLDGIDGDDIDYDSETTLNEKIDTKVDKVNEKGLSTNDYTDAEKAKLAGIEQGAEVNNINSVNGKTGTIILNADDIDYDNGDTVKEKIDKKVDKASGKGLSTNDYTTAEKNKLAGVEQGAEVNVQPDWNQNDSTKKDFIKNKPENPYVVLPDWNDNNPRSPAYIANRTHYVDNRTELIDPNWEGDFAAQDSPTIIQSDDDGSDYYKVYKLSANPTDFSLAQLKIKYRAYREQSKDYDEVDVESIGNYMGLLHDYIIDAMGYSEEQWEQIRQMIDETDFPQEPEELGPEDGQAYIQSYGWETAVQAFFGFDFLRIMIVTVAGNYDPIGAGSTAYDVGVYAISHEMNTDIDSEYSKFVPLSYGSVQKLNDMYLPDSVGTRFAAINAAIESLPNTYAGYNLVHFTTSGSTTVSDKTAAEIYQMISTGKLLYVDINGVNRILVNFISANMSGGVVVSVELQTNPAYDDGEIKNMTFTITGTTVTIVNNTASSANEPDLTIDAYGYYDSSKEEWDTGISLTYGNNQTYSSIVNKLKNTNLMPTVAGGIKITGDFNGMNLGITTLPSSMFALDMGDGDTIMFFINHAGLGTILCMLVVEDEEVSITMNLMS